MLLMLVVTLTGNFGLAPMDLLYFDPEKVLKFQVRQPPPAQPAGQQPASQPGACLPGASDRWSNRPSIHGLRLCCGCVRADLALRHQLLLPGPAGLWLLDAHDDLVRPSLSPTHIGARTVRRLTG